MKIGKLVATLVLFAALCVMGWAGVELFQVQQVYAEGDAAYEEIAGRVRGGSGSAPSKDDHMVSPDDPTLGPRPTIEPQVYIPEVEIDFSSLTAINKDSAAWLFSPDTVIDYPVMAAADYTYYLNHLPDGAKNANGSLFIDYNNAPDFSDPLTVIYGHHMKSGKMFGGLKGYKAQEYFDDHPFMYLYTEAGNYRIDLMYGFVIDALEWSEREFMFSRNVDALIAHAAGNTTFRSDINHKEGDRIVALST